VSKQMT